MASWIAERVYGLNRAIAASRVGSMVYARTLHHVDRAVMGLTGGRLSVTGLLGGLTIIRLTTVGRKTGKERTVPLVGFRDDERWVVVASNWGGEDHPAWYYNLRDDPTVEVTTSDGTAAYEARKATGGERERLWERATAVYPGYAAYERRTEDRQIPVVVLEPTAN